MSGNDLLQQARQAAKQLIPYLPRPSLYPVAKRAGIVLPALPLFALPVYPAIKVFPTAIFDALAPIRPRHLPKAWAEAHRFWRKFDSLASALRLALEKWGAAKSTGTALDLADLDAGCAGVLVLAEGAQTALGQKLFQKAVSDAAGAYIAASAPYLRRGDVEQILQAVCSDPERLFWLGQDHPIYRDTCCALGSVCDGIYAGLSATQGANAEWFERLARKACTCPMAASTALVLLPRSPVICRKNWINCVMSEPRWVYETVRWAAWTWPGGRWLAYRSQLRPYLGSGCWRYLWCRDVESQTMPADSVELEPLWCAELAVELGRTTLPSPIRQRLWRQLSQNRKDREALLLLCQRRNERGGKQAV